MAMTDHDFSSFGALLHTSRKRAHLTQQELARAIGVHRRTLVRWEQGDSLPQSKAMVLELARRLKLDNWGTYQLLEASLTVPAPYFLVPLPRNPYFTGREEILETLHTQLGIDRTVALTKSSALHGLGGVGKTQIALEYAYRHALEYRAVFWIRAETTEQIIASFWQIAELLHLPECQDKDQEALITAVKRWLISRSQWLFIWDNLDDLMLLDQFLPSARSGALLLTTRLQALGTFAQGLSLRPMEEEEALLFLLRRAKVLSPGATSEQLHQFVSRMPSESAAAADLVTELGGLPLALDQAGAYIEETQCALSSYLDLFRTRRAVLLASRGDGSHDHPASVSTTLTLAIQATAERHPAVLDLLRVCALLHSDAIPEELFHQGAEHLGTQLQSVGDDPLRWDRVVGVACAYSLLSRQPEERTFSIHRLVQAVLLDTMTEEERERWSAQVTAALDVALPEMVHATQYATWKQCERLLLHVLQRLQQTETTSQSLSLASLAYKTACYLVHRGWHAEAEPFFQRALRIREQALGPEHLEVAALLNRLAILSLNQDKPVEAEPLLQRALHIREQALGLEHPEVAISLNSLAAFFWTQGKYAQAEPLFQRALRIREQALGPEHPEVAVSLGNLAELYWEQGKYAQAEPLAQHSLQIWKQALGPEHPNVAEPLHILANLYQEQGVYAQAELLYQQALRILEQTLGPEHPRVAIRLNSLADCYRMQHRDMEAEPLYQRALQIWKQTLGPESSAVAEPLNGLANLFRDRSHYLEAEPLYQRALSLREKHLGQRHPDTAQTLYDFAIFHQKQGHLSEASSLAQMALSIRSQTLGETHPNTVAVRTLYEQLLREQADAQVEKGSQRDSPELAGPRDEEQQAPTTPLPLCKEMVVSSPQNDLLQAFLDACCELHPLAWCRSADLWRAYQGWVEKRQERYPLSRGAFIAQLKAHGCSADRTMSARIWRGIALIKKES